MCIDKLHCFAAQPSIISSKKGKIRAHLTRNMATLEINESATTVISEGI